MTCDKKHLERGWLISTGSYINIAFAFLRSIVLYFCPYKIFFLTKVHLVNFCQLLISRPPHKHGICTFEVQLGNSIECSLKNRSYLHNPPSPYTYKPSLRFLLCLLQLQIALPFPRPMFYIAKTRP